MLHRFHPTTTQIRATAPRIAPTTPRTITGRDHFTQQRRQPKFTARGLANLRASFADHPASLLIDRASSARVARTSHAPPRATLHTFRPRPALHANARSDFRSRRSAPASFQGHRRTPTRPRRVTPLARLHRKKPPCIARNGRAAAPARARGTFCADANPPALAASRPLHARTAKPRRARWQRSRRGSRPRLWGSASRAPRPPVPASGEVRRDPHPPALAASRPLHACTAMKRPCFARNGRAAAPARAVARSARMPHPPSLASRPLHARTAMKPPCSRQRARRFPPREWHAHREDRPPDPRPRRVTPVARSRLAVARRFAPQRSRHGSRPRACGRPSRCRRSAAALRPRAFTSAAMKQLRPPFLLRIPRMLDLQPLRLRRVRIRATFRHDAFEIHPHDRIHQAGDRRYAPRTRRAFRSPASRAQRFRRHSGAARRSRPLSHNRSNAT